MDASFSKQDQRFDFIDARLKHTSTSVGVIQYACPSFTLNDNLKRYNKLPEYFIMPTVMFQRKNGILLADLQNPIIHKMANQTVKSKRTQIICNKADLEMIRPYLQECILGPILVNEQEGFDKNGEKGMADQDDERKERLRDFRNEFHSSYNDDAIPNFRKENSFIFRNAYNLKEPINIDSFVQFILFSEAGNKETATLSGNVIVEKETQDSITQISIFEGQQLIDSYEAHDVIQKIIRSLIEEDKSSQIYDLEKVYLPKSVKQNTLDEESFKQLEFQALEFEKQMNTKFNEPMTFGYTPISCSITPDETTGFILWVNGRAALVDPPLFSTYFFERYKIPTNLIDWVILTHAHSDCDIGILQRLVESSRMEIISSKTVINSFIKKYAQMTKINGDFMRRLFKFQPVVVGAPINLNGCIVRFNYGFHTVPCLGFQINNSNYSFYFTGHTCYDPSKFNKAVKDGSMKQLRYELLANLQLIHSVVLFDCGNQVLHTEKAILSKFHGQVKDRFFLYNSDQYEQFAPMKILRSGLTHRRGFEVKVFKAMDTIMKLEIMSMINLFEGLTLKNLRDLIDCSKEEFFSPGQLVMKQGTTGNKWYIVLKGIVQVSFDHNKFQFQYQTGNYFGEGALGDLDEDGNIPQRLANIRAITDVHLLTLEKQDFWFCFGQGTQSKGRKIIDQNSRLRDNRKQESMQIIKKQMILHTEMVNEGQMIWKVKDDPRFIVFVQSGSFSFFECPEEEEQIVFKSGDFIGQMDSLVNNTELLTSLKCLQKGTIFQIYKNDLLGFLRRNPGLFLAFGNAKFII